MREYASILGHFLIVIGVCFLLAVPAQMTCADGASDRKLFRILSERLVPIPLVWAFDIRWRGPDKVLVAAGTKGVFELSSVAPSRPVAVVPGGSEGGHWLSADLASSGEYLVVAAPMFSFSWSQVPRIDLQTVVFDAVVDVDVYEKKMIILGARRDEKEAWAADGAMAWFGPVAGGAEQLHPILFSRSGPGAKPMADCVILDMGGVRFLSDGSFVVVPGAEPGVFWFSPSGELLRTWESHEVGLEDECESVVGNRGELFINPDARSQWLNQHRFVDEILPLPSGPGLVIRETVNGITRWSLVTLDREGGVHHGGWLPVTSKAPWSHLRGDILGDQAVFLVVEFGRGEPGATPRLIFAELE